MRGNAELRGERCWCFFHYYDHTSIIVPSSPHWLASTLTSVLTADRCAGQTWGGCISSLSWKVRCKTCSSMIKMFWAEGLEGIHPSLEWLTLKTQAVDIKLLKIFDHQRWIANVQIRVSCLTLNVQWKLWPKLFSGRRKKCCAPCNCDCTDCDNVLLHLPASVTAAFVNTGQRRELHFTAAPQKGRNVQVRRCRQTSMAKGGRNTKAASISPTTSSRYVLWFSSTRFNKCCNLLWYDFLLFLFAIKLSFKKLWTRQHIKVIYKTLYSLWSGAFSQVPGSNV